MIFENKKVLWIVVSASFVMLLAIYSCASFQLPAPRQDIQSILIIPTVKMEGPTQSHFNKFELYVKGMGEKILLNPRHKFTMISMLEPGEYEIYKLRIVYEDRRSEDKTYDLDVKFTLKPGYITILSSGLYWQMFSKGHKRGMYFGFGEVPDDYRNSLISELRKDKNFHLWSVLP
ncbi:MAG: hypothetical protein JSV25_03660 [Spirochaetota bacterium]|nr:MAG: hypothetical protein JSV25_03660 [Spirochaetota bacterium]